MKRKAGNKTRPHSVISFDSADEYFERDNRSEDDPREWHPITSPEPLDNEIERKSRKKKYYVNELRKLQEGQLST